MSKSKQLPWYRQLTGYHWFVFIVASAAWTFDCLDQRLFSLARVPAIDALTTDATVAQVQQYGKYVTAIFLIGWGIGGMFFGALGDRYGRAKMLTVSVLIYSVCTGANFFSQSVWDFAFFRFLTGVGVGGVFGLAVALIAETVPDGARAGALGMLQILSAGGNILAVFVKETVDSLERSGTIVAGEGWRYVFLVGILPAALVIFIQGRLKEPEPWLRAKEAGTLPKGAIIAPYAGLVSDARWRRNLIVGAILASTGVIGLWAIGEYAVDIQKVVFQGHFQNEQLIAFQAEGLTDAQAQARLAEPETAGLIGEQVKRSKNIAFFLQMVGAAIGMWIFSKVAIAMGRRPAFAIAFVMALFSTAGAYWFMETPTQAYWMMPLMAASQLALFAGYAIYLPELFPSRLRSTGTSFCYNLGRFAAAGGSFVSAWIAATLFGFAESPLRERYAAVAMCSIFLVGLVTLLFAPETKDQPLPE
ncbi:putative sialic acid transporter [Posidoniimonas polymericola]|uniref:Putative sialic acid transporter n=1 Tax=Posidoniimonas polymericola TaxID=2528002 RepID=A0A5C5YIF2_9BACT|nr:MFS transporter [Posidoniimonas polymericola]TWT74647.1 putative sialic acid transporter [Posidoniimonas polymericola]